MNDNVTKAAPTLDGLRAIVNEQNLGHLTEDDWKELIEHISVHRYLVNQTIPWTISWDDAVFSWYENVLIPVLRAAAMWEVRSAFPGMSLGRLYLAITTHWYYLLERDGNTTPERAAIDFSVHYGQGPAQWFSRFLSPRR